MNILLRLVALTTIVWGCSVAAEAGTIGFRGPRPKAMIPWEYVFDVNGVEYEVESTARAYMAVYVTDDEPIEVRTHASGGGWQQTDVEELIGFHDGSRFKIVTYPSIRLFPRIYTQVYRWVGDSVGDNFGFNAQTEEYVDLVKSGIIDPVKVVRTALQDAASVAGLIITTEASIAEAPKKDAPAGGMPGGGMGGMGGMDF